MMVALVVVVVAVQISPSGAKERGVQCVPSQEEERVNKQGEEEKGKRKNRISQRNQISERASEQDRTPGAHRQV